MREIKFRGLSAEGRMVYGSLLKDLPNSTAYYKDYSQRICWFPESGGTASAPVKNGTVGQYTGLKDANGTEIYEGDIVQDYTLRPRVVSFNDNNYANMMGWNLLDSDGEPDEYYYGVSPDDTYKVIGNIYENPELMR